MEDETCEVEWKPGMKLRLYWKLQAIKGWVHGKMITFVLWLMRKSVGEDNLTMHARRELELAGLFDKDSDYGGMMGPAVMNMIYVFASEGHSGFSAHWALGLFEKVASFQNLTPITSNSEEWCEVSENLWQCRRDSRLFSHNGGKTWYNYEDCAYRYRDKNGATFTCNCRLTEEEAEGAELNREPLCDECMMKDSCERRGK